MIALVTERLILRAWKETDAADMFEYAKSPLVGPMAGWKPHESVEESLMIIRAFIAQDETWAVCLKENERAIGSIGLHTDGKRDLGRDRARMLGYVLSERYSGREIIPEAAREVIRFAFEVLDIEILSVIHYPHNVRSRRVIEKLGFHPEGTLRKAKLLFDGRVMDDVCYSLTRQEYVEDRIRALKR